MFFSLDDFLASGIPSLIDGKPRFKALFASYNYVGGYRPGPVVTHDPRLAVTLYMGYRDWGEQSVNMMLARLQREGKATADDLNAEISRQFGERKVSSQLSIGRALEREYLEEGEHAVLVAYAGRHPYFVEAVAEVVNFGLRNPTVPRVLVTCNCHADEKHAALGGLMDTGEITHVVTIDECGGNRAMGEIMEKVIAHWRVTHQ